MCAVTASTKRSHESWASSGGVFASGEQIHRQISTSSMLASPSPPAPPSPSNVLVRKKMVSLSDFIFIFLFLPLIRLINLFDFPKTPGPKQKSLPPKSPVAAQDEIEIEIAEVLYGMMRQPQRPSKQEFAGNDSGEIGSKKPTVEMKSSPIFNSQTSTPLAANSTSSNVSAIGQYHLHERSVKSDLLRAHFFKCSTVLQLLRGRGHE